MSQTTYPALDEGSIHIILKHLQDDPNYLENPDCPYTAGTKSLFVRTRSTDSEKIVNNIQRQIAVLDKLNSQMELQSDRFDDGVLEPEQRLSSS